MRACVPSLPLARTPVTRVRFLVCVFVWLCVCVFVCPQRRLGLFDELVALLRELGGFAGEKAHKLAPHNAALSQQAKQLYVYPASADSRGYSRGTRGVLTG